MRYSTVASELNSRRVTADDFAYGVKRFTAGMCKKVMLANSSGAVASMVLDSTRLTVASSWLWNNNVYISDLFRFFWLQ